MPLSHRQLLERGENPIHRDVHIPEFREIANEEFDRRESALIQKIETIIDQVAESVIGSYSADVNTIVEMSFDDAQEMFHSKKAREYVSRAIVNSFKDELHKRLKNITIK